MENKKTALDYAKAACDTMMRKFEAAKLPPEGHFHYHQGVFLSGVYQTYELCKEEKYFQYIKEWVDSIIDEEGHIHEYDPGQLDDIQPGILLFPLLERTKEVRYQKALDELAEVVLHFKRNKVGGFFHKDWHPHQMWLDGLYMGGPIIAEYGHREKRPEFLDCCIEQALLMRRMTEDKQTGLWYHAWDCSKEAKWADPETGLSPEFWGRSMGWVPVAVLDELDFIPTEHPKREEMCQLVVDLLTALCRYQSEEGRWYQVVNKGGCEGNWLENSCSSLYTAAICKAVRKGLLDEIYLEHAKRAYEAVIASLTWEGEDVQIGHVCIGTGVGDYKHYCERPVSVNDLHGVGAFLLMCAEVAKTLK
ncbi:MAG: glycoside hydrolase family 88 protein [Lachnospiraceae bacterium]|nr:glycoside hydrolase family 88 protein [Lachnospiraceae bacterium]